jgi:hypothetical protein
VNCVEKVRLAWSCARGAHCEDSATSRAESQCKRHSFEIHDILQQILRTYRARQTVQEQVKMNSNQQPAKIPELVVGGHHDWLPQIIDYLDSKGALYSRWMDPSYRMTLVRVWLAERDPIRKLKIRDRLMEEKQAIGLVRLHVCKFLNGCTARATTLRGLFTALQKHATMVSVTAVGHYQKQLNEIKCKMLEDVTMHISEFDLIIKNLSDNQAEPAEPSKCASFLSSWPPVLSYKVELLEEQKDLTYEHLKSKLTGYALDKNLQKKEAELKSAFSAEEDRREDRETGRTSAPRIRKRDFERASLEELEERTIKEWRRHLAPRHQCPMGARCWFKETGKERRPALIEKFIQEETPRDVVLEETRKINPSMQIVYQILCYELH